jgi:hypothetical protein
MSFRLARSGTAPLGDRAERTEPVVRPAPTPGQPALARQPKGGYGRTIAAAAGEAVMIAISDQDRRQLIARGVASEYARDKVAAALFEAVLLGLEFGPRDLPLAEDREWIRGNIAVPLQEATDAALQVLVMSVARTLERAPEDFLDRFERSHHLETLGIE